MKKNGFTLVELLAVVVVLALIFAIAIPTITNLIDNSRAEAYNNSEKLILKSAKLYVASNQSILPQNIGDTTSLLLSDLVSNGFITNIKDPYDQSTCSGYIAITKIEATQFEYTPHINCDANINSRSEDKLLFHYKFDDFQEPTTNIIPNGALNAYPKAGNQHATYNTSQYNNNAYFSIGTIDNITNNIVTLATVGRPIYTYDVLTPQTTGGGVVAGTAYFIKRISANSFSLHQYDSTPDGSKGFGVYNSIYNDQRISINSTNFPTMWWGPAHLANTSPLKEIIPNCYSSMNNTQHECIRLHTEHKPDGEAGGMAYGVSPVVTSGKTYTVSFYYRAASVETIGKTISLLLYTNGSWPGSSVNRTITSTNWERYEFTLVAPASGGTTMYFWPAKGSTIDISEIQFEEKNGSTPFTDTTRTGLIKDYSGNNKTITLTEATTPRWVSDAQQKGAYLFNGVSSTIQITNPNLTQNIFTLNLWMNPAIGGSYSMFLIPNSNGMDQGISYNPATELLVLELAESADTNQRTISTPAGSIPKDKWSMVTVIINSNICQIYINGKLVKESVESVPIGLWSGDWFLGQRGNNTYYYKGYLDDVRLYGRALTANEIRNIYNGVK